jgi:hypothetical protein
MKLRWTKYVEDLFDRQPRQHRTAEAKQHSSFAPDRATTRSRRSGRTGQIPRPRGSRLRWCNEVSAAPRGLKATKIKTDAFVGY